MKICIVCKKKPARIKYCAECAEIMKVKARKEYMERNPEKYRHKSWRKARGRLKLREMTDASECVGNMENAIYN